MTKRIGRPPLPIAPGQRFGKLVAIKQGAPTKSRDRRWWLECDCGFVCVLVSASNLTRPGGTRSCGCIQRESARSQLTTHGKSKTPEYRAWRKMRARCNDPSDKSYSTYGGRGIRVCARWESFEAFYEDMGPRPSPEHSLERPEVDGDYGPDNCIWGTPLEQARNKRTSIWIEHRGERLHIKEWAERTGIDWSTLRFRCVDQGWSAARTLETPADTHRNRGAITFQGQTLTITQWAKRLNAKPSTIHHRLRYAGWSVERALTTPVHNKKGST